MSRFMIALAALALVATPAIADYITPDSIPNPPPASTHDGVGWTPVGQADYVTIQYADLVFFPVRVLTPEVTSATAIASVSGVNVWTAVLSYGVGASSGVPTMDFLGHVVGTFTQPVDSVSVDVVLQGRWMFGGLSALRADGSSCSSLKRE